MKASHVVRAAATLGTLATLVALAAACSGTVVVDGDGEGGAGSTATSPTTSSPTTSSTSTSTTSGTTFGPAFIYESGPGRATFRLTSFGASCDDPQMKAPFEQCDWADLEIDFPLSAWAPGTKYDESSSAAECFVQESGKPDASGVCSSGGGGGGLFGTFVIDSVSSSSTVVILSGWNDFFLDHEVDGSIVAENCAAVGL